MTEALTPAKIASSVENVKSFDPGLGAYNFENLGQAVQFADIMSRAGEMLPDHLRQKPALCLAITMRAVQWGFDPFGLAMETYQAKPGGVIGYQAKVFAAALRNTQGIQLQYRYEGKIEMIDKPVVSHKGREIAKRTATGNRCCTAFATVDGELLEYTTLPLDMITIKNSPLWHNDPDQQLAYAAARGWVRRYRPEVMMGAFSADEVEQVDMKDVTPQPSGFARLAQEARQKAAEAEERPDPEPETEEAEAAAPEPDEARLDALKAAFNAGMEAAAAGFDIENSPHKDDEELDTAWREGWKMHAEVQK